MLANWNPTYIDPGNLIQIARGDESTLYRYLQQFQELIPGRIDKLKSALAAGDRLSVRQLLHQMSPQLQFFGVPNIVVPIQRLEREFETMPLQELESMVKDIISILTSASKEVDSIIEKNFSNW
jgi:HPt (histidine-containing phosphotransfer) domain-containing protein